MDRVPRSAQDAERFSELAALEPRLLTLSSEARDSDDGGASFCANAVFHGEPGHRGLKERIAFLVGWTAGTPASPRDDHALNPPVSLSLSEQERLHKAVPEALCSQEAYDLVYSVILTSLPPCRNCACVSEAARDLADDADGE
jgi:hypothetical protein